MEDCILSETNLCYDVINIIKDFYYGDKNYWKMQYKKCMDNINYLSEENSSVKNVRRMTFKESIFMSMNNFCYNTDDEEEEDPLDCKNCKICKKCDKCNECIDECCICKDTPDYDEEYKIYLEKRKKEYEEKCKKEYDAIMKTIYNEELLNKISLLKNMFVKRKRKNKLSIDKKSNRQI